MPQEHMGDRVYVPSRLAPELAELVRADAERLHVPAGDVVGDVLARHYQRRDLTPVRVQRARAREAKEGHTLI